MQQKEKSLYCVVALCQKCWQEAERFHISLFWPSQMLESEKWSPSTDLRETSIYSRLLAAVSQERYFPAVWALKLESPESNHSLLPGVVLSCLDTTDTVEMAIYHFSAILPSTNGLLMDSSESYIIHSINYYMYHLIVVYIFLTFSYSWQGHTACSFQQKKLLCIQFEFWGLLLLASQSALQIPKKQNGSCWRAMMSSWKDDIASLCLPNLFRQLTGSGKVKIQVVFRSTINYDTKLVPKLMSITFFDDEDKMLMRRNWLNLTITVTKKRWLK